MRPVQALGDCPILIHMYWPECTKRSQSQLLAIARTQLIPKTSLEAKDGLRVIFSRMGKSTIFSRFATPAPVSQTFISWEKKGFWGKGKSHNCKGRLSFRGKIFTLRGHLPNTPQREHLFASKDVIYKLDLRQSTNAHQIAIDLAYTWLRAEDNRTVKSTPPLLDRLDYPCNSEIEKCKCSQHLLLPVGNYCEISSENLLLGNWNANFQENNSQTIFPCNSLNHKPCPVV